MSSFPAIIEFSKYAEVYDPIKVGSIDGKHLIRSNPTLSMKQIFVFVS